MRADAASNRERVLEAAERIVRRRGAASLTIAEVAAEARVGKATVIRRFGDKATLIATLLGEEERRLQEQILRGRPPLGPGAPALDRIEAFLAALTRLYLRRLDLVYASETSRPGARYRTGAHAACRQHLTILVEEARPDLDAPLVAHLLLAPLAAEALAEARRMRRGKAMPDAIVALARGLLTGPNSASAPERQPSGRDEGRRRPT